MKKEINFIFNPSILQNYSIDNKKRHNYSITRLLVLLKSFKDPLPRLIYFHIKLCTIVKKNICVSIDLLKKILALLMLFSFYYLGNESALQNLKIQPYSKGERKSQNGMGSPKVERKNEMALLVTVNHGLDFAHCVRKLEM